MASLAEKLTQTVGQAFKDQNLPEDLGSVKSSDRPDLAQFQCNGAMAAARIAGKSPRDVAGDVTGVLQSNPHLKDISIAGPGFINANVTDEYLSAHLSEIAADPKLGVATVGDGQTVVLDYGGPNIAKPMHVGHLRSSIIGDTLRRIYGFAGWKTYGDVHIGDWGTQLGMVISEYLREGREQEILDLDMQDEDAVTTLMEALTEIYPRVSAACKEDDARKAEALEATVKMQDKQQPYYKMWEVIRSVSIKTMKKNFDALNVQFDLWKGEADANDYIAPMVKDLQDRSYAIKDDGAVVVQVKQNEDNKEIPPLILYKRDGGVMYGTTDLATIVERVKLYDPSRFVYVVDQRQHLHFVQVFRAAQKSGITDENTALFHAGFGTMNGTDGKPFKTRAGGVMRLDDLISMAVDQAKQRLAEANLAADMDQKECDEIAHKVAIAAIKFADLQNQRTTDYIFDLARFTSFEGKTGPYLLYQVVRIKSLLAKAGAVPENTAFKIDDADRGLALLLSEFPDYFHAALRHDMPHHLCEYAYKLAGAFSSFYSNCHILSETDEAIKHSRIALCQLTQRHLECVLGLLGIEIPDRM